MHKGLNSYACLIVLPIVCNDFQIIPFIKYHLDYELQTQNHSVKDWNADDAD